MDGNHVFSDGRTGSYDTFPLAMEKDVQDKTFYLYGFTEAVHHNSLQPDAINYATVLGKSASMNAEEDNYWLRGGCGKAAAMISKDLDQKTSLTIMRSDWHILKGLLWETTLS